MLTNIRRHMILLIIAVTCAATLMGFLRWSGWPPMLCRLAGAGLGILIFCRTWCYLGCLLYETRLVHGRRHPPDVAAFARILFIVGVAALAALGGYLTVDVTLSRHFRQAASRYASFDSHSDASFDQRAPQAGHTRSGRPQYDVFASHDAQELLCCCAATLAGLLAWHLASRKYIPRRTGPVDRPPRGVLDARQARVRALRALPKGDAGIPWGAAFLPTAVTAEHCLVLGTGASGKSLLVRLVMQHALGRIGRHDDRRALVYDGKRQLLSYLHRMRLRCPIKILHPFDVRGAAWDIAADCDCPLVAREIAAGLLPDATSPANASRELLATVLAAFHAHCPGVWTLRDVLLALEDIHLLKRLFDLRPETRNRLGCFTVGPTLVELLTAMVTQLAPYRAIAAAWAHATEQIAVRQWAQGAFTLVLSTDDTMGAPLDAMNQILLRRAAGVLLAQDESPERETWIVVDELSRAGNLDRLSDLLSRSRSFGIRLVVSLRDVESLSQIYGEKEAQNLLASCHNKALLQTHSPETAKWAKQQFDGHSDNEDRIPAVVTEALQSLGATAPTRDGEIAPTAFLSIPPTSRTAGLTGYFLSPAIGAHLATLTTEYLDESLLPRDPTEPNYLARPADHQILAPWTAADLKRLRLEPARDGLLPHAGGAPVAQAPPATPGPAPIAATGPTTPSQPAGPQSPPPSAAQPSPSPAAPPTRSPAHCSSARKPQPARPQTKRPAKKRPRAKRAASSTKTPKPSPGKRSSTKPVKVQRSLLWPDDDTQTPPG